MKWAWLGAALIVAAALLAGLPRIDRVIAFDPGVIGPDPAAWLAAREAEVADIVPGAEARVEWAGPPGEATGWAILYVHGFSASSEELRPVPRLISDGLGANLVYARLPGHARDGAAMAETRAGDWIEHMAAMLAVVDRVGERVLVIGTSTGGTLLGLAAADPRLRGMIDAAVFVSPNFDIAQAGAWLLRAPWARLWLPWIAGPTRSFEPQNSLHARFWTESYPTEAVVPMAALVGLAHRASYARATMPALFLYSPNDEVVDHGATRNVAAAWAGPTRIEQVTVPPGGDPRHHNIAGDILTPANTRPVAETISAWLRNL